MKEYKIWLKYIAASIVLLAIGWFASARFSNGYAFPKLSVDKWQAVFLDNDQVYFGKVNDYNRKYIKLTDVYYLRAAESLNAEKGSQNINLVKLGGEFHGPEDLMFIQKDKIVLIENLSVSSSVVKLIQSKNK